jgi:hypothetical protein
MPRVRFEPTIPVFERAKTVHVLRLRGHCNRHQNTYLALIVFVLIHYMFRGADIA